MTVAPEGGSVHVDVGGGRQLGATDVGAGRPTVVFEAGMGAARSSWALVAPAVAERTRVITYDRAGFGASPADPEPRTLARAAQDLTELLRGLDTGPAILVGHSYGGPIVREVAATAPELVAGLVLVDQTDEACDLYFDPSMDRQAGLMAGLLTTFARLGLARLVARRAARPLPPEAARAFVAESSSVDAARAHARELAGYNADLRRLRDHPHPPLEVPVTLISGTRTPRGRTAVARRRALVAAHERRAGELAHGRHVAASRSEHLVMFSEPEVVVAEVLRLVDQVGVDGGATDGPVD